MIKPSEPAQIWVEKGELILKFFILVQNVKTSRAHWKLKKESASMHSPFMTGGQINVLSTVKKTFPNSKCGVDRVSGDLCRLANELAAMSFAFSVIYTHTRRFIYQINFTLTAMCLSIISNYLHKQKGFFVNSVY